MLRPLSQHISLLWPSAGGIAESVCSIRSLLVSAPEINSDLFWRNRNPLCRAGQIVALGMFRHESHTAIALVSDTLPLTLCSAIFTWSVHTGWHTVVYPVLLLSIDCLDKKILHLFVSDVSLFYEVSFCFIDLQNIHVITVFHPLYIFIFKSNFSIVLQLLFVTYHSHILCQRFWKTGLINRSC